MRRPASRRLALWLMVLMALGAGLLIGARRPPAPASLDQRTLAVARGIRCPSCEDLNAAQSNAPGAVAVRRLIRADLARGESPGDIDAYLVGRYGPDIVLSPSRHGWAGLVWWAPGLLGALALVGSAVALRRWRAGRAGALGPGDEERVRRALEDLA